MAQKEKEVYLDFEGTISLLKSRGADVDLRTTAKEVGYTEAGLGKLRKKAPKSVAMVHKYIQDNGLEFGDLVKER